MADKGTKKGRVDYSRIRECRDRTNCDPKEAERAEKYYEEMRNAYEQYEREQRAIDPNWQPGDDDK
jgi:hypothetical protein